MFTHEQFELICQYGDRLTFCFDGDEAGRRASMKAFGDPPLFTRSVSVFIPILPSGEDPDSFIQKQRGHSVFQEKLDSAIGFTQFLENAALGLDLSQLDQKAQFLKRLHEKTALMPTSIMKKLLLTKHQFKAEPNNLPKIQSKRTRSRLLEIMFSHPNIFKQYRDTIRVITYLNPLYIDKRLTCWHMIHNYL